MKNILARIFVAFIICQTPALAVEPPNAAMKSILHELKGMASPDDFQQISDAIALSETLQRELNELAGKNQFTGFSILPREQLTDPETKIFGGFTQGSKIVFASEFLKELKKVHHVFPNSDFLPNNTVFVLSHLLYHIRNPVDPFEYTSRDTFVEAKLNTEASAFIHAWNTMLQVAERSNNAKPLSMPQYMTLLMNARYRFALLKAMEQKNLPLEFSPSGSVEINDENIRAVAAALRKSTVADIE